MTAANSSIWPIKSRFWSSDHRSEHQGIAFNDSAPFRWVFPSNYVSKIESLYRYTQTGYQSGCCVQMWLTGMSRGFLWHHNSQDWLMRLTSIGVGPSHFIVGGWAIDWEMGSYHYFLLQVVVWLFFKLEATSLGYKTCPSLTLTLDTPPTPLLPLVWPR